MQLTTFVIESCKIFLSTAIVTITAVTIFNAMAVICSLVSRHAKKLMKKPETEKTKELQSEKSTPCEKE